MVELKLVYLSYFVLLGDSNRTFESKCFVNSQQQKNISWHKKKVGGCRVCVLVGRKKKCQGLFRQEGTVRWLEMNIGKWQKKRDGEKRDKIEKKMMKYRWRKKSKGGK